MLQQAARQCSDQSPALLALMEAASATTTPSKRQATSSGGDCASRQPQPRRRRVRHTEPAGHPRWAFTRLLAAGGEPHRQRRREPAQTASVGGERAAPWGDPRALEQLLWLHACGATLVQGVAAQQRVTRFQLAHIGHTQCLSRWDPLLCRVYACTPGLQSARAMHATQGAAACLLLSHLLPGPRHSARCSI